jgi:hypothetical protein
VLPGVSRILRVMPSLVVGILKGIPRVGVNHNFHPLTLLLLLELFYVVDRDTTVLPAEDSEDRSIDLLHRIGWPDARSL